MRQLLPLALIGVALAGAAACAHVQAAAPQSSPLDVPAPPPRVVVPPSTDATDVDVPTPATTPPPVATTPRRDATPPVRPPDRTPTTPPASAAPPTTETTPTVPLETTSDTSALKTQTRQLIDNANRDLGRVARNTLSQDAKAQYDRAKSFVKQADNALREGNYTYAHTMAEKAAALAGQLPKTRDGADRSTYPSAA